MRKLGRWRGVVLAVVLLAAVVFVPPLVSRTRDAASGGTTTAATIVLNEEDLDAFDKFFPGQPDAVELAELQSLWGWDRGGPYGWENQDRATEEVTVVDGRRRSYAVDDPQVTVWLFGGSTVFGIGQREDHTIASVLVRLAEERGVRIAVENFGVSGYVNWQETQQFHDALRIGGRPDLAVFFDGANETTLAVDRERFGLFDESVVHHLTMEESEREALAAAAAARGHESSGEVEVIGRLGAGQYRRGVQWARELSDEYEVPVVHFWQPQLYTMPVDAPLIRAALEQWQISEDSQRHMDRVVDRIADASGVDPIDLTDVLDDASGPTFYDTTHTNELGARLTAEAMFEHLWPEIRRRA